jgi:uncharacterized protein YjbI with pentapeptide repeats
MKRDECSLQEQWVLEQLEGGEIADLVLGWGPGFRTRRLRATFLEALLTDDVNIDSEKKFTPHRKGIRIDNAVIPEVVDLENAEVAHIVALKNCFFEKKVNFRDAHFRRHLLLNGSHFKKMMDCHRLRVETNFFCRGTIFQSQINLNSAEVGGQFSANRAQFNNKDEELTFTGLNVGGSVSLRGAFFQNLVSFDAMLVERSLYLRPIEKGNRTYLTIFRRGARFGGSDIRGQLVAPRIRFLSESERIDFDGLRVGRDAHLEDAIFRGPVSLRSAYIGGQFNADGAQFGAKDKDTEAIFNAMNVGEAAFFRGVFFQGVVSFDWMVVQRSFYLTPLEEVDRVYLTIFQKGVRFGGTEIRGQLVAHMVRFLSELEQAKFNGLMVGHDALFSGAIFQGPVDFTNANIVGQFSSYEARFRNEETAIFRGLKVGQIAIFEGASFNGSVALDDAHLLDLQMGGESIPTLNLVRTHVERKLKIGLTEEKTKKIRETEIGLINARNLVVQGPATLEKVTITGEADLRYARFQTLELKAVEWPQKSWNFHLEGLKYQSIQAYRAVQRAKQDLVFVEDHDLLLKMLDGASFHTQPYYQLENCWQQHGEKREADKVFLRLMRRQAKEYLGKGNFLSTIWIWFLLVLAGYGRRPWLPLIWAMVLFIGGLIAFGNPANMIPRHASVQAVYTNPAVTELYTKRDEVYEGKAKEHYCWYWYTIDLMLPVDLEMAKYYEPKVLGARVYFHLLPLFGWVIIAALAASLTGLFELKGHLREH